MNRLVYGVGVDLTSAIPIQLFGDMLDEVGQPRLVVGSYDGARSLPPTTATVPARTRLGLVRRTVHISSSGGRPVGDRTTPCPDAKPLTGGQFSAAVDKFVRTARHGRGGGVPPRWEIPPTLRPSLP